MFPICVSQGERGAFTGGQDAQSHQGHISHSIFTQITGDINNKLFDFPVTSNVLKSGNNHFCNDMQVFFFSVCVTIMQQYGSQCHSVRVKFNDSWLAVAHDYLGTVRNGNRKTLKL